MPDNLQYCGDHTQIAPPMEWLPLRCHDYSWHFVSLLLTSSQFAHLIRNSDLSLRSIPLFKLVLVALGRPDRANVRVRRMSAYGYKRTFGWAVFYVCFAPESRHSLDRRVHKVGVQKRSDCCTQLSSIEGTDSICRGCVMDINQKGACPISQENPALSRSVPDAF